MSEALHASDLGTMFGVVTFLFAKMKGMLPSPFVILLFLSYPHSCFM
jgi:hypothetical protein